MTDAMTKALAAVVDDAHLPASEAHGGNRRPGPGAPEVDPTDRARDVRAVQARLGGHSWSTIAEQCGYGTANDAMRAVNRALTRHESTQVETLRAQENARLDRAQAAIWGDVLKGDLAAVNAFLRISARRAKMNGLDAPTQVNVSAQTREEMETALQALSLIVLGEDGRPVSDDPPDPRGAQGATVAA